MNDAQLMTYQNENRADVDAVYEAIKGSVLARIPGADEGWIYDLFHDGCSADEIIAEIMTNYEGQS